MPEEQISGFCCILRAARGRIVTEDIPGESFRMEKTAVQVRRVFQEISVCRMMTVRPLSERAASGFNIVQICCGSEHERKPATAITIDVTGLRHFPGLIRIRPSYFGCSVAINKRAAAQLCHNGAQGRVSPKCRFRGGVFIAMNSAVVFGPGLRYLGV